MRSTGEPVRLWDWLTEHDVRLDIRMECELDPQLGLPVWHCEILGFSDPNGMRPAVFILKSPRGREVTIEASDPYPDAAYREAVHQLRGKTLYVLVGVRNQRIVVPLDLTI